MIDNPYLIFYGSIAIGVAIVLTIVYFMIKKLKKHGTTHKPQVMNKIRDFYSIQDASRANH